MALCEPSPRSHEVPFDPVKKKLLELYGSDVDHRGFVAAYKLVVLSGGCDSPTFKDLFNWADYFVDEGFRTFPLESYITLASYPDKFPNIVKMQIKHTWVHRPSSFDAPTSIAQRLEGRGSTYAWPQLMDEIEEVSRCLPNFALTVVEGSKKLNRAEKDKAAVKWHSELEILLIGKIISHSINWHVKRGEYKCKRKCAELIAKQLIELKELTADYPLDVEIT